MLVPTGKDVVPGLKVARMEEPKGSSMTIRCAPEDPSAIRKHPGHHLPVGDTRV